MEKTLQRQHRLGPDRQFRYVYRRGARVSSKDLTLVYVKNQQKRVGFSVGKKVGGAVVRNHIKRQLREVFRPRMAQLPNGLYVVVARPGLPHQSFTQLSQSVDKLLRKLTSVQGAPGSGNPSQSRGLKMS